MEALEEGIDVGSFGPEHCHHGEIDVLEGLDDQAVVAERLEDMLELNTHGMGASVPVCRVAGGR